MFTKVGGGTVQLPVPRLLISGCTGITLQMLQWVDFSGAHAVTLELYQKSIEDLTGVVTP